MGCIFEFRIPDLRYWHSLSFFFESDILASYNDIFNPILVGGGANLPP